MKTTVDKKEIIRRADWIYAKRYWKADKGKKHHPDKCVALAEIARTQFLEDMVGILVDLNKEDIDVKTDYDYYSSGVHHPRGRHPNHRR